METLSVDQAMFRQPIHVGERVTFFGISQSHGSSSMEIGIQVIAENIQDSVVRHVNSCFFNMVAVDTLRRPAPGLQGPKRNQAVTHNEKALLAI